MVRIHTGAGWCHSDIQQAVYGRGGALRCSLIDPQGHIFNWQLTHYGGLVLDLCVKSRVYWFLVLILGHIWLWPGCGLLRGGGVLG